MASARPRRCPRSPCCDPGREAARARRLRVPVLPRSPGHLPKTRRLPDRRGHGPREHQVVAETTRGRIGLGHRPRCACLEGSGQTERTTSNIDPRRPKSERRTTDSCSPAGGARRPTSHRISRSCRSKPERPASSANLRTVSLRQGAGLARDCWDSRSGLVMAQSAIEARSTGEGTWVPPRGVRHR
jgi:hypothetical protein